MVAYAIAGRVNIDLTSEPLGTGADGKPVYLRDVWPSSDEIAAVMQFATDPATYRRLYGDFTKDNPLWNAIPTIAGPCLRVRRVDLHRRTAVLRRFHDAARRDARNQRARALCIFGDSVTTDHISPAGSIKPTFAGRYLSARRTASASRTSTAMAVAAATTK